ERRRYGPGSPHQPPDRRAARWPPHRGVSGAGGCQAGGGAEGGGGPMSRRVLVVDDDESIRQFSEMALRDDGFEVAVAPEGATALLEAAAFKPDVILLDMRMPGVDGWTFAETYRAGPGPHAPILVLTA